MKIEMIALRQFPLGKESRRLVEKGETYEVNSGEVEFHETTMRGKRANPDPAPKPVKTKES